LKNGEGYDVDNDDEDDDEEEDNDNMEVERGYDDEEEDEPLYEEDNDEDEPELFKQLNHPALQEPNQESPTAKKGKSGKKPKNKPKRTQTMSIVLETKQIPSGTSNIQPVEENLPMTQVEREFECQVCLDKLKKPVMMPCGVHSLCLECLHSMYKKKREENRSQGNNLSVECPTCGEQAGNAKFKNLKVNKELERVMNAYQKEKMDIGKERESWMGNKKEGQVEIVSSKEERVKEKVDQMEISQLREVALKALKELMESGKSVDHILDSVYIELDLGYLKRNDNVKENDKVGLETDISGTDSNEKGKGKPSRKNKVSPNTEEDFFRDLNESNPHVVERSNSGESVGNPEFRRMTRQMKRTKTTLV